jgi:hypothetical protein
MQQEHRYTRRSENASRGPLQRRLPAVRGSQGLVASLVAKKARISSRAAIVGWLSGNDGCASGADTGPATFLVCMKSQSPQPDRHGARAATGQSVEFGIHTGPLEDLGPFLRAWDGSVTAEQ